MSITTIPENRLTEEEKAVISYFRMLNSKGRKFLLLTIESYSLYPEFLESEESKIITFQKIGR